ncbi:mitochondrial coenzyme A diphosphatase NUDT8-like [Pectinophora gossypiella]|uniref:mitochondrial coenzyme A diphosphatase NUDT8-like n=1 Tax=Pectinophora gossypiella TaxID=13191 RepID=UPI00214F5EBE|nr:mitochondrial coenzyme A diphosphatase NUDT8-like [Pectinophora gossypiella]
MYTRTAYCVNNIFSNASRERCLANLKKMRVPDGWKGATPTAPNASVLIPVCSVEDNTSLLYTIRSPNLRSHSGQISFPGGKMDEGETPIQAALRETQEEIGLSPTKIDVWGHGPPIQGRDKKFLITPVIGTVVDLRKTDLHLNTKEVAEVFCVPLEILCNPKNQFYTQFRNGFILPVFVAEEYKIWGITAYLTHTFLSCLLPKEVYRNEWTKKKINLKDNEHMQLESDTM